jgi:tRNA pseudouridine55 synthase
MLGEVVKKEKEYFATVRLGAFSATDDGEGQKTEVIVSRKPSRKDVQNAIAGFMGVIPQIPPRFSALKRGGKVAYKLARAGKEVVLSPRKVEIKEIKLVSYHFPLIKLRVVTGPGVYIRSLARDIGDKLKTGGYLAGLERTRVGDFKKRDARKLFM